MIIDSAYQRQLIKKDKERIELQKNSIFKYKPEKAIIEYFKEHVIKDIDNIKLKICEQFDSMHFEVQPSENGVRYVINLHSIFDYCWNTLSSIVTINEKPVANDIDNESRESIRKICIKCGNRFYTSARNALRCPECRLETKRENDKMHKREKRSKEHKKRKSKKDRKNI